MDSDTRTILSTVKDNRNLTDRLLGYFFRGTDNEERLYEEKNLYVQRSYDSYLNMEYMELWGLLTNNNMIFMRTPLESIRDSVNRSLLSMSSLV